jgi:hypothetical protein
MIWPLTFFFKKLSPYSDLLLTLGGYGLGVKNDFKQDSNLSQRLSSSLLIEEFFFTTFGLLTWEPIFLRVVGSCFLFYFSIVFG